MVDKAMKKNVALVLLFGLLLCGCASSKPVHTELAINSQVTTETTAEAVNVENTVETKPEKVKVYLLDKTVIYDSGFTSYHYDEDYNIDFYKVHTIENDLMCTTYFENKDEHGMATQNRMQWASDESCSILRLTYTESGKLKEEREAGDTFTGFQYVYDNKENLVEVREYYEGTLNSTVRYEYNVTELHSVYCEDPEGNRLYDCCIENNFVVEKVYNDSEGYSIQYEYDENGNLAMESVIFEGEHIPGVMYYYKEIEVDADRAPYLLEQQKYLQSKA